MSKTIYELLLDIMNPEIESDTTHIREVIFLAEDTGFSIEQSKVVSPWLLNYALENRDSSEFDDIDAVYSAIRTGASMLYPNEVECLFPLLETGHEIDIVKVTVKMIGRIFESHPPSKIGEYEHVADKIYNVIESILKYSISELPIRQAAIAQLCAIALVAMGSKKIYPILEKIKNQEQWFKTYIFHSMEELRVIWKKRTKPVPDQMAEFLDTTISFKPTSYYKVNK